MYKHILLQRRWGAFRVVSYMYAFIQRAGYRDTPNDDNTTFRLQRDLGSHSYIKRRFMRVEEPNAHKDKY